MNKYNIDKNQYNLKKLINKSSIKKTITEIKNNNDKYKIGIYGIFIGIYIDYLKDFIESINTNFFPEIKKKFFIVTDHEIKSTENMYIYKINNKYNSWPFPTLFRFKYFLSIPKNDYNDIDYMFFLNGNAIIKNKISFNEIPIRNNDYIYTYHHSFLNKSYNIMTFEKNTESLAYIPYDKNYKYEYIGGRFYGAKTEKFIELCKKNFENIGKDLEKNIIACWHDESHLNNFFYLNKKNIIYILDKSYHVPEEIKHKFKNINIIYLDKRKNQNIVKLKKNIVGKCDVIITKEIINDYYDLINKK